MSARLPFRLPLISCLLITAACTQGVTDEEAVGWTEASHSSEAEPDYDTVFPQDTVQRLDVWIDASSRESMAEEMDELYSDSSGGPGGGPGGGGGGPDLG